MRPAAAAGRRSMARPHLASCARLVRQLHRRARGGEQGVLLAQGGRHLAKLVLQGLKLLEALGWREGEGALGKEMRGHRPPLLRSLLHLVQAPIVNVDGCEQGDRRSQHELSAGTGAAGGARAARRAGGGGRRQPKTPLRRRTGCAQELGLDVLWPGLARRCGCRLLGGGRHRALLATAAAASAAAASRSARHEQGADGACSRSGEVSREGGIASACVSRRTAAGVLERRF